MSNMNNGTIVDKNRGTVDTIVISVDLLKKTGLRNC